MKCQNYIIPFGKYKGKDLLFVAENNPQYLNWLGTIVYESELKTELDKFLKTTYFLECLLEDQERRYKSQEFEPERMFEPVKPSRKSSNSYNCGWGCTSYNPNCDACDGYLADISPGIDFRTKDDYDRAHKRAIRGFSPWNNDDDEDEGEVGW